MSLFGGYTVAEIGAEVQKQMSYFDSNINALSDLLAFGLNDEKYSRLFDVASKVSTTIGGVCVAIAVIYAYAAIVKEGINLRGDWKRVVSILLKLSISKGLIDTSTQFMAWIFSFFSKISQLIMTKTNEIKGESLDKFFSNADIGKALNIKDDGPLLDRFVAMQYAKFLGFGFFILGIILLVIGITRILKIYLMLSFSAVVFAKIPMYGWDGCKEYVKELCALGLQGGIIAATICLFQISTTMVSTLIKTTSTWGALGGIIILIISMMLLIFKSEEIARKVV